MDIRERPEAAEGDMRRLLIVSDAWHPQVNGVVRSLDRVGQELRGRGFKVRYLTPSQFRTMPLPSYPEIRLSLTHTSAVARYIRRYAPDCVHIATEGPLGLLARRFCASEGLRFTTSYHTRFPEYLAARLPVPTDWSYAYLRWFHGASVRTMVPAASICTELTRRGFSNLTLWSRGVDTETFSPGEGGAFAGLPGPHLLYAGRLAVEKNVTAFLDMDVPGTKILVGDGPCRAELQSRYPEALFLGFQRGERLAHLYRSASVLVFPSRTDTFGNVILEALASGLPVAAYPVPGPVDILTDTRAGALDEDLEVATMRALTLRGSDARTLAQRYTWSCAADQFMGSLSPIQSTMQPIAA
ncbi:glycosyltransferase family 4 protein [Pelagibacterium montanilacus]|uniref:glycosyltransferase family 4 protein n=1 Tax=Pelagibacterium montanilacus TaxID=2185280 RepID=UPI001FE5151A|nr:glycosyltransferase family 1 protein [Pelagibacterium montanilacus]